jgi:hypothetical protein
LSNAGDRDNLLAHPQYLILGPEGLAEGRTFVSEEDDEVTANPHAQGFYSAAGFIDCGIATTAFGPAQRKRLRLH